MTLSPATVGQLDDDELRSQLAGQGLHMKVGPYTYALASPVTKVAHGISRLYSDYPLADSAGFSDFHVSLRPAGPRQWFRRELDFFFDGQRPFGSIPSSQAYAFLEWGMNWCLSVNMHEYLKLHAAVVAKDGLAVVMPGLPGAGKSTLCAALAQRGWRVLSDEHALIVPGGNLVVPVNRPVSLKNESIDIIRDFEPSAVFGPVSDDTHKGRVAHMKSDLDPASHHSSAIPAVLMVFPSYRPGVTLQLSERSRAESFIFAAHHSFNYSMLGEAGFDAMAAYIDAVQCYDLQYSRLDDGIEALDALLHEVQSS